LEAKYKNSLANLRALDGLGGLQMNDETRGKIRNVCYAEQIIDFSGLRFGNITPTNIDGYIDFWGKGHVFFEAKHKDAIPPLGQKLAFERVADPLAPFSIYIIASHNSPHHQQINAAEAVVSSVRFLQRWIIPDRNLTTKVVTEYFLDFVRSHNPDEFYNFLVRPLQTQTQDNTITLSSLEWLRLCP
jgi:hypothetical protein